MTQCHSLNHSRLLTGGWHDMMSCMRYHLYGVGFEGFDIDKHLIGVTTQSDSGHPKGQYAVKDIRDVLINYDGKINVLVELLEYDEHLPVKTDLVEEAPTPTPAEEIPY